MSRWLLALTGPLLAMLAPAAPAAQPSAFSDRAVLSVEAAVQTALARNPALAGMRSRAQALAQVPSQAGSLPDPRISFNALNLPTDTFATGQEPMTQLQVGVSQAIPFPGKRGLRAEAARLQARAADQDVDETRLRLIRDVRASWWRLFYLDRALDTVAANQDLLRQLVKVAATKYRVGRGLQQDVLLAQLELSRLLDQALQLKAQRSAEAARLDALLNRPTDLPVRLPRQVTLALPRLPSAATLLAMADRDRPLLRAQARRIGAAESRVALAEKGYLPDFSVGAAYGFRSGRNSDGSQRPDFASFMFSMSLPLYAGSKQSREVDQRTSELITAQDTLQDRRQQIHAEVISALADYQQARDAFTLFRTGILPQARQTVDAMLAGYQVNKVDFLNLVRAQTTLYDYETRYWKSLAEARQSLARLTAAVGKEQLP